MTLFGRLLQVTIGKAIGEGAPINDLKINFNINKAIDPTSNSADIRIHNMNESVRNNIRELDDVITVKGGYADDAGLKLMYVGDILKINHKFQGTDIISVIEAGDGAKPLREKRISISFKEGAEVQNVLQDVASKLELTLRPLPSGIQGQYVHGFSFSGAAREGLNKVTEKLDLKWSVQNNELQIINKDGATKKVPKLISYETGLIEKPEKLTDIKANLIENQPKPGYSIKSLLLPDIEPGQTVNLNAGLVSGVYRVDRITHTGDNEEADFMSTLEVSEFSE